MKSIKWANVASVSTAASATSDVITLHPLDVGISIQLAWTGTTAGTVKLQASNDAIQWNDVDGITDDPAGSASNTAWDVAAAYFQYVRVVFTRSGGTGLLSGTYNIKRDA